MEDFLAPQSLSDDNRKVERELERKARR